MSTMTISTEELLKAIQRDFPLEYELCAMRTLNAAQARRIAELERALAAAEPPPAAAAQE